jgi:hypothetical protein
MSWLAVVVSPLAMAARVCAISQRGRAAAICASTAAMASGAMPTLRKAPSMRPASSSLPAASSDCIRPLATANSRRIPSRASSFCGSCFSTAPYNSKALLPRPAPSA